MNSSMKKQPISKIQKNFIRNALSRCHYHIFQDYSIIHLYAFLLRKVSDNLFMTPIGATCITT